MDIVLDAGAMQAEVQKTKSLVSGMGDDFQRNFNLMSKAQQRATREALLLAQAQGKSVDEPQLLSLAARGAAPAALEIYRAAAAKAREETQEFGNQAGMSARQYMSAMRGIAALASGQNPMRVLLSQGVNLSRMFSGGASAAGGFGSAVLGLVNPFTLAAGAAAALGVAWYQGSQEGRRFANTAVMIGNYAGITADKLNTLAWKISHGMTGATRGAAAEAINQATATGQFTTEQIGLVSKAALQMQQAVGKPIKETIDEFVKLQEDPVRAILELNKSSHFLTQTVWDQILALKEQGRAQEAVDLAFKTHAETINTRAPQIAENLGWVERRWRDVRQAAAGAWDGIKNIDRMPDELSVEIAKIESRLNEIESNPRKLAAYKGTAEWVRLEKRLAELRPQLKALEESNALAAAMSPSTPTVDSDTEKKKLDAQKAWESFKVSMLEQKEKLKRDIDEMKAMARAAGPKAEAEIAKYEALMSKRFAESEAKKASPADSIIDRITKQIALNEAQLTSTDKLTASEKLLLDVRGELDRLGGKVSATERATIEAKLVNAAATGKAVEQHMREIKAKEDLARLNTQLTAQEADRAKANTLELLTFGRGQDELSRLRKKLDLQQWYTNEVAKLRDKGIAETDESYKQQEAALRASLDRQLQMEEAFQNARISAMGNWRNGAASAMQDYMDKARDISGQSYDVFSGALSGLEDRFAEFARTGKMEWSAFFDDLAAEITKFLARQVVMKLLQTVATAFGGGGGMAAANGAAVNVGGSMAAANGAAFNAAGVHAFARGGTFTNRIVAQPTLFKFAKGTGLMGEAGPEAIMPLTRTASGRLGVVATGGGGGNLQVVVNNYAGVKTSQREERTRGPNGMDLRRLIIDIVADDIAAGGKTALGTKSRFGLREAT
jgi:lambda family phage tail tape measure protein